MPKLKVFSGKDIIRIFEGFGFVVVSQKGSHVKLQRITSIDHKQSLTIPNHKELGRGTVKDIFNQATQYILREELAKHFYHR